MSEWLQGVPPGPARPAPADAAVAVPLRFGPAGLETFWVRRDRSLRFAAGFFAFPGGRLDAGDTQAGAAHAGAEALGRALVLCAVRELFEETGLLAIPRGELLPKSRRDEGRRRLLDGSGHFVGWCLEQGLAPEAAVLHEAGRWVTPESLPLRFDTRFFLVLAPDGQEVEVWPGELELGEWVRPEAALARWAEGSALLHPPNLHVLRCLARFDAAGGGRGDVEARTAAFQACLDELRAGASREDGRGRVIELQRGVRLFPLRSQTLPPATHTGTYVLGNVELLIVDCGGADEREIDELALAVETLRRGGATPRALVLTHFHADHVAGAARLAARLDLPVWAHRETAARVGLPVARCLEDGELLTLGGAPPMRWRVWHTPGHAPGHLCLLDEASRAAVVGDMVAGEGTILIDPKDGDMAEYQRQLARLQGWPVGSLYPAHGTPLPDGVHTLGEYLRHRAWREAKLLSALSALGPTALEPLVERTYDDLPGVPRSLTELSARAILEKLRREGRVDLCDGRVALRRDGA